MNNQFKAQLLKSIATKKQNNEGFTLIELLVVVIIIGVLAAIALPNLLGQVGKAREVEAKNLVGSINGAQQSAFTEKGAFQTDIAQLEVTVPVLKFYEQPDVTTAGAVLVTGTAAKNKTNGTRDYVGGVAYNTDTKAFSTIIGRANAAQKATDFVLTPADVTTKGIVTGANTKAAIGVKVDEIK